MPFRVSQVERERRRIQRRWRATSRGAQNRSSLRETPSSAGRRGGWLVRASAEEWFDHLQRPSLESGSASLAPPKVWPSPSAARRRRPHGGGGEPATGYTQ